MLLWLVGNVRREDYFHLYIQILLDLTKNLYENEI